MDEKKKKETVCSTGTTRREEEEVDGKIINKQAMTGRLAAAVP